jgi:predicted CoA-binding protein
MQSNENPREDVLRGILSEYRNVAVVGLSNDPTRPSYVVAEYLENHGFNIVPVNPFVTEVLGEKSYKSLLEMPVEIQRTIEIVDIFRRSEDVPPIVEQAVKMKELFGVLRVVWMQLGVINEQAAESARKAGLTVVMDKCIRQEHHRLFGKAVESGKC